MTGEPMRWCAYGQHRVSLFDMRDEKRAICSDCHCKRERDNRNEATRDRELRRRWKYLIHYAHDRARKKGLPFDLLDHQDAIRFRVEAGACELTGLPFNAGKQGRAWDSPSIDRIEPQKGYVYGNIRVILYGLNEALSDHGEEVLRKMTEYLHRD